MDKPWDNKNVLDICVSDNKIDVKLNLEEKLKRGKNNPKKFLC